MRGIQPAEAWRAVTVDVPEGTRPLVALGRDSWPLGHRETEGAVWFAFVESAPQVDRAWTADTALWKLYVEAISLLEFGWTDLGKRVAALRLDAITGETFRAASVVMRGFDVSGLASRIVCPTLIIMRSHPEERDYALAHTSHGE